MSNIWLTRPINQVEALTSSLVGAGNEVLHLPMIEIEPLAWDERVKSTILNFDQYDSAFFISTNAARLGMECVSHFWPQYPAHIKNFALGPSSAAVIQDYALEVLFPKEKMSSEAVLALDELNQLVEGQKVLIFRGVGGRETLAKGLQERGAQVDYLELYRRNLPIYSSNFLQQCLKSSSPDAVVISSAEALDNFEHFLTSLWPDIHKVSLYVSSSRIAELASNKGFVKITEMPGANDEAILRSLKEL